MGEIDSIKHCIKHCEKRLPLTWSKICENLSSIGRRSCEIIMKEKKHPHHTTLFAFRSCLISKSNSEVSTSNSWKNYFFFENYVTSEGAVSHKVLFYQQLSITHNQVRFFAAKHFE